MPTAPEEATGGHGQGWVGHEDLRGERHRQLLDPQQRQRLGHRGRRQHDHRFGGHQTAGGGGLVGQQAPDRRGLVGLHRLEEAGPLDGGQLTEQVGGVVGVHGLEHVGGPGEVEPLDDVDLLVLRELLEQVGEPLVLHDLGQALALLLGQGADAVGHVGRTHLAQPGHLLGLVADLEEVGGLGPGHDRGAAPPGERAASAEREGGHLPVRTERLGRGDPHVEDGEVAHLLADDVAHCDQLALALAERTHVDRPAPHAHPGGVDLADAADVDEDVAALDRRDEPDHPRGDAGGRREDDVVDVADGLTVAVDEGETSDPGHVSNRLRHVRTLRRVARVPWSVAGPPLHSPRCADHSRCSRSRW